MCNHNENIFINSRRQFLQQIASGVLTVTISGISILTVAASKKNKSKKRRACATTKLQIVGCSLKGTEARKLMAQLSELAAPVHSERALLESSGDARLDQTLGILLMDMIEKFKVHPGVAFYDYNGGNNALAFDANYLPDTTGTVLLGRTLVQQMLQNDIYGDMPIMGTCAHEFGHIVQYQNEGVYERLTMGQETAKRVELHADFLTGYYIGRRGVEYGTDELIALGRAWEELGDNNFSNPQHHGTPEERLQAMEAGYRMASEAGVSIAESIAGGLYYLRA